MGAERPLNPEQQAAIRKALGQEVTFIWGPPGTGKTSTLARLVEELVAAGERVLIASHTNAAVDVAFEPVAERLSPDAREQGATVRVGTPQRRSELVQQNTLDAIVERRSAGLQAERQAAERRKEDLERRLQDIEAALGVLEGVRQADAALRAARDAHTQAQQALEAARSEAAAAHAQITALRARLQKAEAMGWLRRALTGMHPATIRQKLAEAEQAGLASAQRVVVRQQEADAAVAALRQAEAAYRAALARRERLGVTADEAELRRRQRETTEALQSAQRRLAEIDAAIAALARVILREARVVATTLARLSIMDELLAEPYDTVVVDEASIIPVPYVWLAALVAKRRVVVAGDFRQLPPIAMGEDEKRYPRAARWLARDVFAAAGILEDGRIRKEDKRLAKLSRQYRMHPDIGGLVNVLVYERDENKLHHEVDARSDHVRRGLHAPPEPGHPLVLCDTSDANPWCARDESRSRYNLYSVVVAVRLAALAVASHPDLTVGLVTPYRPQVRLLQALAQHYALAAERVRIATVHRFQGDQQDLIILDLVDGLPHRIGWLLKGRHPSPATRLLNVACSRARGKLVVVAHTAHLGRLIGEHSLMELLHTSGGMPAGSKPGRFGPATMTPTCWRWRASSTATASPCRRGPSLSSTTRRPSSRPSTRTWLPPGAGCHLQPLHPRQPPQPDRAPPAGDRGARRPGCLRDSARERAAGGRRQPAPGAGANRRAGHPARQPAREAGCHRRASGLVRQPQHPLSQPLDGVDDSIRRAARGAAPAEVMGAAGLIERSDEQDVLKARRQRLQEVLEARVVPPPCPLCGQPTHLVFGRYGPFFGCPMPRCKGKVNLARPVVQAAVDDLQLECPTCGSGRLRARWGQHGAFLSCSRYPECRHSEDL